jgi:hypothetical protein
MKKKEKARRLTIEIFKVILEEHNGYTSDEIKKGNLAEKCETDESFQRIQEIIEQGL